MITLTRSRVIDATPGKARSLLVSRRSSTAAAKLASTQRVPPALVGWPVEFAPADIRQVIGDRVEHLAEARRSRDCWIPPDRLDQVEEAFVG